MNLKNGNIVSVMVVKYNFFHCFFIYCMESFVYYLKDADMHF